jgi:hypothetical protein
MREWHPGHRLLVATPLALVAMIVAGCGSSGSTTTVASGGGGGPSASALAPIHRKYSPSIDPSNFVTTIDNPYWPLKPGTTFHYKGARGTTPKTDDETVTDQAKNIIGIPSTVVDDVASSTGRPSSEPATTTPRTRCNVRYMGEDSFETNAQSKMVRASDSWLAGVNGGQPGIIMPGNPKPGDAYRQEYYPPGKALDEARVLSSRARRRCRTRAGTRGCW